jgi:type I restriction enzyme S subunit
MRGKWKEISLHEAGVSLIDCVHKTPPAAESGYPYVAIPQLKNGRIDLTGVRLITEEHFTEWTKKADPQPYDVILSRRCNPGETAFVHPGFQGALGQNLVLLRSDGKTVFPPFLRWLVRSPQWWEQIGKFLNVGAVFDSLKCADIPNFQLLIPPMDEQKEIAHILGTLDDKIELNQQMNRTLEGIARALFKSWFIDFDPVRAKLDGRQPAGKVSETQTGGTPSGSGTFWDAETAALFPDSFEDSPLGKIPKGWRVKRLSQVTTKIGSGATPRGGNKVYVDEGIALIRSQNVYDYEFRWDGLAFITEDTATQLKNVVVKPDDILLNITGDSILRTCVVEPSVLPARVNQHVAIIRPKPEVPCRYLHLYLVHPQMKSLMLGFDTGATRKAITKGQLESLLILLPTDDVLRCFDKLTNHLFQQVQSNISESRALAAIRDILLPKLLSGKIHIKEAEQALEAVA